MAETRRESARIVNKHDIEANWNKIPTFVPLKGEIIIYDIDEIYSYERIKIGDGITSINNLPFAQSNGSNIGKIYYDNKTPCGEIFGDYETNAALGKFTAAFGSGSTAGQRGYYMKAINFGNSTVIALSNSKEKVMPEVNVKDISVYLEADFVSGFAKGDQISIINNGYYYYCSTITAINNNLITVKALPFTRIDTTGAAEADNHLVFVPAKPKVGRVSFTPGGIAAGLNVVAGGKGAFACGRDTVAAGGGSFTAGRKTKAGYIATATGFDTFAPGNFAFTTNSYTLALAQDSAAFGMGTAARGNASFSTGSSTIAAGDTSASFGVSTQANGKGAFVSGDNTQANGDNSFAANTSTRANGLSSAAFGNGAKANGIHSFACGNSTTANGVNGFATGYNTITNENNSAAFGNYTQANGLNSFASGNKSIASNIDAFAANNGTVASGEASATFGMGTAAKGIASLASGSVTKAIGKNSFTWGEGTIADTEAMQAGGKYNLTTKDKILVYGKGINNEAREDAYILDKNGNGWYAGNIEASAIILRSSTPGSTMKFKITVNDSGSIKATAI